MAGAGGGSVGGGGRALRRTRSTASVTSHSSYASVQSTVLSVQPSALSVQSSTAHGPLPPSALGLGDGRILEGVKRRDAHEIDPLGPLTSPNGMATPSPELLAGRPRRNSHRRSQSAAVAMAGSGLSLGPSATPIGTAGSEDAAVRRAISEFQERDDAQPVQSMREAEVRKVTNIVKKEIKYKLGKLGNLHKRAGSFSGGGNDASVQLQRASGCLT